MLWFTESPVNALKFTSARLEDIPLTRTQTSAASEHAHNTGHHPLWNEVKFIDRDPHCYTRRVKAAIHPININRNSRIEITEAWMPTIKKCNNRRAVRQRTAKETIHRNSEDRMRQSQLLKTNQSQQSIMLYKVTHNKWSSSPEED